MVANASVQVFVKIETELTLNPGCGSSWSGKPSFKSNHHTVLCQWDLECVSKTSFQCFNFLSKNGENAPSVEGMWKDIGLRHLRPKIDWGTLDVNCFTFCFEYDHP